MKENISRCLRTIMLELNSFPDIIEFYNTITRPIPGVHNHFLNFCAYPYESAVIENIKCGQPCNMGIVMQGPIFNKDNFTRNTLELYTKIFVDIPIVVSTWIDQDTSEIEKLNSKQITIIKNHYPQQECSANLNKMIKSCYEGLKLLKQYNLQYALRTRTDHRIYAENCGEFLVSMLQAFPLTNCTNQHQRILILDTYTLKYVPYNLSDTFQFGAIEDILEYWNVPFADYQQTNEVGITIKEEEFKNSAENYLGIQYAKKKMACNYEYTYEKYYSFLKDRFIVIDTDMINLLYFKLRLQGFNAVVEENGSKVSQLFRFKDWLLLQSGMLDLKEINEELSDKMTLSRNNGNHSNWKGGH